MRFGESVALTWEDVNFKEKTIHINKTSVELHGSPYIQEHTKTESGMRTISISDNVINFLKEVKRSLDLDLNYRNLVIPNTRYNIITSANARRRWQRVCACLLYTSPLRPLVLPQGAFFICQQIQGIPEAI